MRFSVLLSVLLFTCNSLFSISEVQSESLPIYIFTGEAEGDRFGFSVASAGDVNNDGYDDIIVGAKNHSAKGSATGRSYVFSGLNGDTLFVFTGETALNRFGRSVASAGDVNNDGFADLILGAPGYMFIVGDDLQDYSSVIDHAFVFSGLDGDTLFDFSGAAELSLLGLSVASAGDVNNDGYDDLVVGAPGDNGNNKGGAYVFSGLNGDTLHIFSGEEGDLSFGGSVASAGDVNNDGFADLIIGAPTNSAIRNRVGRAYVFSGLNGDTIHVFSGDAASITFGAPVGSAGDVNNDGYDDLIVGARLNVAGGQKVGRAYVFSGLTGGVLNIFAGTPEDYQVSFSVASAGDVNNDGVADLVIGSFLADGINGYLSGRAYVYSGVPCCDGFTGNVDDDSDDTVDISDLTLLIDHLFINFPTLSCLGEGNVSGDLKGVVDIADLTFLIDHLFINFPPTAVCQ